MPRQQRMIWILALGTLQASLGCTSSLRPPNLAGLYDRAAMDERPGRNPVVVIPGILGSRLQDTASKRMVWGAFSGDFADPQTADGVRLFALPMQEGAALRDLTDEVTSIGALDRVKLNLLGLPLELNAYANILAALGVGGYRDQELGEAGAIHYGDEHFTCFQFHYDWRRDNIENARRLDAFLNEKRAYVRNEIKKRFGIDKTDIKFDIVAHSMGGLVTRYFLRYGAADLPEDGSSPPITWAGAEMVDRAVLVGTPNAGSVNALLQLVEGRKLPAFLPYYQPAVLGTFPSIYQLMPRPRHGAAVRAGQDRQSVGDFLNPEVWEQYGWSLASRKQDAILQRLLPDIESADERRKIALDHLAKCLSRARRFHAALDTPAAPPPGLDLYLFAGDAISTAEVVAVDSRGRLEILRHAPGDGTVTRSSALMDERLSGDWSPMLKTPIQWRNVTFLFKEHVELTQAPAFCDNLLYLLLESP